MSPHQACIHSNLSCTPIICHVSPSTWHESPATSHLLPQPVMYPIDLSRFSINLAWIPSDQSLIASTCHVPYPINLSRFSIILAWIPGDQSLIASTCHVSHWSVTFLHQPGMNPRRPVTYCLNLSCIPLICHVSPSTWHESPATSHLLPQPVMYPQHSAADRIPNSLSCILTTCHVSH
jgi:hypothetical protein